jgi:ABC-type lipoprotein export system ATPase subunit
MDRSKGAIMSEEANAPVLRARGLHKQYGQGEGLVRAVDGVDLEVAAAETVAVMGPSGCGKSTLLHLLSGLDRPHVELLRSLEVIYGKPAERLGIREHAMLLS